MFLKQLKGGFIPIAAFFLASNLATLPYEVFNFSD
jgi:hypothetical protein